MKNTYKYLKISYYLFVIFAFFLVSLTSFATSVREETAIEFPYQLKKTFKAFFPQGWSFFTRDPREGNIDLYKCDKEGNLYKFLVSGSEPKNLFGISRKSRITGYEVSNILENIPQNKWIEKEKTNISKSVNSIPLVKVKKGKSLKFIKKGEYLMVESKVIPWSWRYYPTNKFNNKIKTVKVQIL